MDEGESHMPNVNKMSELSLSGPRDSTNNAKAQTLLAAEPVGGDRARQPHQHAGIVHGTNTVCPRSSYPIYIVSYYVKWDIIVVTVA